MLLVVTGGESSGVRHKSVSLCVFVIRTNIGLANAHSPSRCAIISSQSHVYRRVEYVGYSFCTDNTLSPPGAARRYAPADGSSTRGGSIRPSADESAVRTRLSCRQPACQKPIAWSNCAPWAGADRRIAVSLNAPIRRVA